MSEYQKLPPSVEAEVRLLQDRVRICAEEMVRHSVSTTKKGHTIANLAIEVGDFIDSVDHRTAAEMGGVPENQDFAQQMRTTAREFADRFPLDD